MTIDIQTAEFHDVGMNKVALVEESDVENAFSRRNGKSGRRVVKKAIIQVNGLEVIENDDAVITSEDDEDDDSDTDFETKHGRHKPPRPSTVSVRKSLALLSNTQSSTNRRRRRSSARFLRLHGGRSNNSNNNSSSINRTVSDDCGDDNASVITTATSSCADHNLSELYEKAIRMNAENKINAGNSWNLRLIDNIDKFLEHVLEEDSEEDDEEDQNTASINNSKNGNTKHGSDFQASTKPPRVPGRLKNSKTNDAKGRQSTKRVNFTKASCTLDASVKIYSYRVDDIHLTSYKVLANLNRSDTNKEKNLLQQSDASNDGSDDGTNVATNQRSKKPAGSKYSGSTIETNLANINLNKLDSAFDIDPLFHKMSKSFDEGGAKGLLLHNLGVSSHGCNIVFDSTESDSKNGEDTVNGILASNDGTTPTNRQPEGIVDISILTTKLEQLLGIESLESFQLVPQLGFLRDEYASLEKEGFVGIDTCPINQRRSRQKQFYEPDPEEEREAEKTIHKIALERQCRFSMTPAKSRLTYVGACYNDSTPVYEDKDYGGAIDFTGNGFDGDDDDFDNYQTNDGMVNRFSSFSFQGSTAANRATSDVLDAISSGNLIINTNSSSSEYFDVTVFKDSANIWAGASHWKRSGVVTYTKNVKGSKSNKTNSRPLTTTQAEQLSFVKLSRQNPDITILFDKPHQENEAVKRKGRLVRKVGDSIQLSKSIVTKYTNNENLLPQDSGCQVDDLFQLFLRPETFVLNGKDNTFGLQNMKATNEGGFTNLTAVRWDDGSFGGGDDNDGVAYDFGGNITDNSEYQMNDENIDEFVVRELEDVRKIEKIKIGYATVAKKVDVKRLKQDLWTELSGKIGFKEDESTDEGCSEEDHLEKSAVVDEPIEKAVAVISFQDTVKDLEMQQSQQDVTLPFYFICILHLANEKCLKLTTTNGLLDFTISRDKSN